MAKQQRKSANVDYCGTVKLLHALVDAGLCSKSEARNIAARLAVRYGATIILDA